MDASPHFAVIESTACRRVGRGSNPKFLLNLMEPDARVRGPHRLDLPFHHRLLLVRVRPQSPAGSLPPPSALLLPSPLCVMCSTPSLSLHHHRLARLLRRREPALLCIRRHHRRICLPHDRRPTRAACDGFRRRRRPTPCQQRTAVEARNGSRRRPSSDGREFGIKGASATALPLFKFLSFFGIFYCTSVLLSLQKRKRLLFFLSFKGQW